MTEYKEAVVESGDAEADVLHALAGGSPYVFVVCKLVPLTNELDPKLSVGGGVSSTGTVRIVLERALEALPE